MFKLSADGTTIVMHRGNTGTLRIKLTGYTFGNDDRVYFAMKNKKGTVVKDAICEVDAEGYIEVDFINTDTDYLPAGWYRYAITAVTDPEYESQKITDGSDVYTPRDDMMIQLLDTAALV